MSEIYPSLAKIVVLSRFTLGQIELVYLHDEATGQVEFSILPATRADEVVGRRMNMNEDFQVRRLTWRHAPWLLEPLVHLKLEGSSQPGGFLSGSSFKYSPDGESLVLEWQREDFYGDRQGVTTRMRARDGRYACVHCATWKAGENGIRVSTRFENLSSDNLNVEMLSSFSLGNITPFEREEACNRLVLHRFRSWWAAEGRRESRTFEAMHLERSWGTGPVRIERFSQTGTMPVHGFFPFLAVEDRVAGVTWAAQLAWPGSWLMEVSRRGDSVGISGGHADRLSGQWMKTVAPGEAIDSPEALVTTSDGDLTSACNNLIGLQRNLGDRSPSVEASLPIAYNDWCTFWGTPTHASICEAARAVAALGAKYYVIDAGWFADPGLPWVTMHGDWEVSSQRFPKGLKETSDALRAMGLVPGIWFEFETCGEGSKSFSESERLLLYRGKPIMAGGRHFLDFRKREVVEWLSRKVIDLLKEGNFGYIKVDYNETVGVGPDDWLEAGEGLRQHLLGVTEFYRKLRSEIPDLVIEVCSSGGHRLEPAMLGLGALGSFSDAHEGLEVPVIAAGVASMCPAEKNLIWAVLRKDDNIQRLEYSLAASFIGRLCLSGSINELSDRQMSVVREAVAFHGSLAGILKDGSTSCSDANHSESWRDLKGWQVVRHLSADETRLAIVVHTFAGEFPASLRVRLPEGCWQITERFGASMCDAQTTHGVGLEIPAVRNWTGGALTLSRLQ